MKIQLLIVAMFIGRFSFAQNNAADPITNRNYYDRFLNAPGHSINWLRAADAVPVIIEQLVKNGIPYYKIGVGDLLKIDDTTRLVITVSFETDKKRYGFVYEPTHGVPLNPKDRDFLTNRKAANFVQSEKNLSNGAHFMRIDQLPGNIFLLKQTCYWFQFDNKATKYNVTKDVAKDILKQDIDDYLKEL